MSTIGEVGKDYSRILGGLGGLMWKARDGKSRVLELGCGTGLGMEWAQMTYGVQMFGLTLPEHEYVVKKEIGELSIGRFEEGTNFENDFFDAVFSVMGLIYMTHLNQVQASVIEMKRVLINRGVVKFNMNRYRDIPLTGTGGQAGAFGRKQLTFTSVVDWQKELRSAGFSVFVARGHRTDGLDSQERVVYAQKGGFIHDGGATLRFLNLIDILSQ